MRNVFLPIKNEKRSSQTICLGNASDFVPGATEARDKQDRQQFRGRTRGRLQTSLLSVRGVPLIIWTHPYPLQEHLSTPDVSASPPTFSFHLFNKYSSVPSVSGTEEYIPVGKIVLEIRLHGTSILKGGVHTDWRGWGGGQETRREAAP